MANNKCLLITFTFLFTNNLTINASIVNSLNDLGISLVKQIQSTNGIENIFISPLSIFTTIAMLYHGSKGHTREELDNTLNYTDIDENQLKSGWKLLSKNILDSRNRYQISLANGLFVANKFQIFDTYEDLLKTYYNTHAENLDFSDKASVDRVNNWTKDVTNGKIKKLLDDFDPQTKLILLNAVYFRGRWIKPFPKDQTKDQKFKNVGFKETSVPMMYLEKQKFRYASNDKLKLEIIEIPYDGKELDMYIILPKVSDKQSMIQLLDGLTIETLEKLLESMNEEQCNLWLPKFKAKSKVLLKQYLQRLGIRSIFTTKADLSAISGSTGLYVSSFVHNSVIDVSEEGAEAAVASGVDVVLFSSLTLDTIDFRVDRPFIYLIRHRTNGIIVFIGIVNSLK